jgi:hypothetical protein
VSRYDEVLAQLEAIAAQLDDFAYDDVRTAIAEGATARPASDRKLSQARRAIEKAATILRNLD